MPFLAAVREAKLRTFVSPGQILTLTASLLHEGSGFAVTRAAVAVDGKTVANSDITFRVMAFPDRQFRATMLATAERIAFPVTADA
jgi:3-hydroxyacyl-[acyl-carrier-protein] dehydratase